MAATRRRKKQHVLLTPEFRSAVNFFREHCGGWVGHSIEGAVRSARDESEGRKLDVRMLVENDPYFEWDGDGGAPNPATTDGPFDVCIGIGDWFDGNGNVRRGHKPVGCIGGVFVSALRGNNYSEAPYTPGIDPYMRCLYADLLHEHLDEIKKQIRKTPRRQQLPDLGRAATRSPSRHDRRTACARGQSSRCSTPRSSRHS